MSESTGRVRGCNFTCTPHPAGINHLWVPSEGRGTRSKTQNRYCISDVRAFCSRKIKMLLNSLTFICKGILKCEPPPSCRLHPRQAYAPQLFLYAAFKCCDFHLVDGFRAPHLLCAIQRVWRSRSLINNRPLLYTLLQRFVHILGCGGENGKPELDCNINNTLTLLGAI